MLNFAVIGYGYWGPNIVRNLTRLKDARVKIICDTHPPHLQRAAEDYPFIKTTGDLPDVLSMEGIDAVAIVTPVSTHFDLARRCLEAGKHIFIEKPFTATVEEAQELVALAKAKGLTIMVDHTFVFTGAVRKIKELIDAGELGDLYYYDSSRVSLGLFQHDVNVIWDLAPHDFSIIDYLIEGQPVSISAQGVDHIGHGHENIAYLNLLYPNDLMVHINVNWLSPVKVRTTLIGGRKKMLVWDDLEADEKIKVYDRGVNMNTKEGIYRLLVDYRSGDMWSPRVEHEEALSRELKYFVHCVNNQETPINDGEAGLRVVKMLTYAQESLKAGGSVIKIG